MPPLAQTIITDKDTRRLRYSSNRDKAELRAAVQESVHRFVTDRRRLIALQTALAHPDWTDDQVAAVVNDLQPEYQEFDPVVEMAVAAVDHRNPPDMRLRALSESAQYLRPKLKSIEVGPADDDPDAVAERRVLASRLMQLIESAAGERRVEAEAIDITPAAS